MGKAAVPPQPRAGRSVRVGAAVRAWNRHRGCGRHAAALQSPIPAPSPRQHGARAQQREANGRSTRREGALGPYILRGQVCTPLLNNCCFQRFWKVLDTWCCPFVNQRRRGPLSGWDLITCTGRGECRVAHESTAPERSSDLERCSIFTSESGNQAEMPQGLVTRVADHWSIADPSVPWHRSPAPTTGSDVLGHAVWPRPSDAVTDRLCPATWHELVPDHAQRLCDCLAYICTRIISPRVDTDSRCQ